MPLSLPTYRQPLTQPGETQNRELVAALSGLLLSTPYYRFLQNLVTAVEALQAQANLLLRVSATADTLIASPQVPIDGQILTVQITQDSTGRNITWSADFLNAPAVPNVPDEISVVMFSGISGKWNYQFL